MTTTSPVNEPDGEGRGPMTALDQLLEVQRHDTRADQIRHRRANLPERAALAEREAERAKAERELSTTSARRDELQAEQDRIEGEVAKAKERIAVVDGKLYGGATSNPRELQALQDEVASLGRRVSLLEDSELEVMEQLEPVEAASANQQAAIERLGADIERLGMELTAAEAELDVDLADVERPSRRGRRCGAGRAAGGVRASSGRGPAASASRRLSGGPVRGMPHQALRRWSSTASRSSRPTPSSTATSAAASSSTSAPCCCGSSGWARCVVWAVFRSPALDLRVVMLGSLLPAARRPVRRAAGAPLARPAPSWRSSSVMLATRQRRLLRRAAPRHPDRAVHPPAARRRLGRHRHVLVAVHGLVVRRRPAARARPGAAGPS